MDTQSSSDSSGSTTLIVIAVVAAILGIVLAIPKIRHKVVPAVKKAVLDIWTVIRNPRKAMMLLGGDLAGNLIYPCLLGLCLLAFHQHLDFAQLVFVQIGAGMLGNVAPVPGGIGVTEAALTGLLTNFGIPARRPHSRPCSCSGESPSRFLRSSASSPCGGSVPRATPERWKRGPISYHFGCRHVLRMVLVSEVSPSSLCSRARRRCAMVQITKHAPAKRHPTRRQHGRPRRETRRAVVVPVRSSVLIGERGAGRCASSPVRGVRRVGALRRSA